MTAKLATLGLPRAPTMHHQKPSRPTGPGETIAVSQAGLHAEAVHGMRAVDLSTDHQKSSRADGAGPDASGMLRGRSLRCELDPPPLPRPLLPAPASSHHCPEAISGGPRGCPLSDLAASAGLQKQATSPPDFSKQGSDSHSTVCHKEV